MAIERRKLFSFSEIPVLLAESMRFATSKVEFDRLAVYKILISTCKVFNNKVLDFKKICRYHDRHTEACSSRRVLSFDRGRFGLL